jgi:hypothetical protein
LRHIHAKLVWRRLGASTESCNDAVPTDKPMTWRENKSPGSETSALVSADLGDVRGPGLVGIAEDEARLQWPGATSAGLAPRLDRPRPPRGLRFEAQRCWKPGLFTSTPKRLEQKSDSHRKNGWLSRR